MTAYHWIIGLLTTTIGFLVGLIVGSLSVVKKIDCLKDETNKTLNPMQQLLAQHNTEIRNLGDRASENKAMITEFTKATTVQMTEVIGLLKELVSQNTILINKRIEE